MSFTEFSKEHLTIITRKRRQSNETSVSYTNGNATISGFGGDIIQNHDRIEHEESQLECKYCNNKYINSTWLDSHIRKHGTFNFVVGIGCAHSMLFKIRPIEYE